MLRLRPYKSCDAEKISEWYRQSNGDCKEPVNIVEMELKREDYIA